MRKHLLVIAAALLLVACGDKEQEEVEQNDDEIEVVYKKEIDKQLLDDNIMVVDLQAVGVMTDGYENYVAIQITMANKENKTYEMFVQDLKVDGKEFDASKSFIQVDEIKPNETVETIINGISNEDITIKEHIQATMILNDYEGNRYELEFNEYINE